ncbi:hypothetical protein NC652_028683 [Populus alba x Populus x berolinensis]|nr:hypothetical protein NC652_028683 [Populus alba x Populus x berolinensis]
MDEVMTAADASSRYRSATSPPASLPSNIPLLSAFLAFSLAQFLKLFTTWFKEKRWDARRMLGSGGMPSSHSANRDCSSNRYWSARRNWSTSICCCIGLGMRCMYFVMYDATGVRLHAGRQAEVVAGAVLGCIIAFLMRSSS